jgi:6-pyruvoyltetrahydropterin/6-carboxytetrahydropterin synthase
MQFESTKIIELGSCAFRQWRADSHCKLIHGYRLVAKFWFACDRLDERNWVVDFGGLKELKQVLEKQFDHTFCVSADDPLLDQFKALHDAGAADLRIMHKGVGIERTADWCFDVADAHVRGITNNRCWVQKVEVWEHDKNSAIVSAESRKCSCDKHTAKVYAEQFELPFDQKPVENVKVDSSTGNASLPARTTVGNNVTTGWSNPFGGTSWGM